MKILGIRSARLGLILCCIGMTAAAQQAVDEAEQVSTAGDPVAGEPHWLLHTMKDSLAVAAGDVFVFEYTLGDVRIEAADTEFIQVTAIAQYHADDPRLPELHFQSEPSSSNPDQSGRHTLLVNFQDSDTTESEAWRKRRIDVGIQIPRHLEVNIATEHGLIEAKNFEAAAELNSDYGNITYIGSGSLKAHSERGSIETRVQKTAANHSVELSTLTGDIHCVFLAGANAGITASTRGPITTDYSIDIDKPQGSPLKSAQAQIGTKGSSISLASHSGGIRLQALIAPEKTAESPDS